MDLYNLMDSVLLLEAIQDIRLDKSTIARAQTLSKKLLDSVIASATYKYLLKIGISASTIKKVFPKVYRDHQYAVSGQFDQEKKALIYNKKSFLKDKDVKRFTDKVISGVLSNFNKTLDDKLSNSLLKKLKKVINESIFADYSIKSTSVGSVTKDELLTLALLFITKNRCGWSVIVPYYVIFLLYKNEGKFLSSYNISNDLFFNVLNKLVKMIGNSSVSNGLLGNFYPGPQGKLITLFDGLYKKENHSLNFIKTLTKNVENKKAASKTIVTTIITTFKLKDLAETNNEILNDPYANSQKASLLLLRMIVNKYFHI